MHSGMWRPPQGIQRQRHHRGLVDFKLHDHAVPASTIADRRIGQCTGDRAGGWSSRLKRSSRAFDAWHQHDALLAGVSRRLHSAVKRPWNPMRAATASA
jgi:hypothetical protein